MAKHYAMHTQHLTTTNALDNVDGEVFGKGVKQEISKAIHVLNDFASYPDAEYDALRRNLPRIIAELNACRTSGQPSKIMSRVRRQYM